MSLIKSKYLTEEDKLTFGKITAQLQDALVLLISSSHAILCARHLRLRSVEHFHTLWQLLKLTSPVRAWIRVRVREGATKKHE